MQRHFIRLTDEPPTRVLQRVAYRLIERHYRANPHLYGYPPAAMNEYGRDIRPMWPQVAYFIEAASRCVAGGVSLAAWRDHTYKPSERAIYKRRMPRP